MEKALALIYHTLLWLICQRLSELHLSEFLSVSKMNAQKDGGKYNSRYAASYSGVRSRDVYVESCKRQIEINSFLCVQKWSCRVNACGP